MHNCEMASSCWTCSPKALAWPWMPLPASGKAHKHHKEQHHLLAVPPITNSPPHVNISALSAVLPPAGKEEGDNQGHNMWLPEAPLVLRPRAHYNAASLAYLGDCIYEDVFLKLLLKDDFLSEEERDIVRWGKNVQTNHKKATKRAGAAVYSRASSLETLIGYLYLTNQSRLQEVMGKLGLTWTCATNDKDVEPKNEPAA